jgi:dolichol-phosphate mannosyltransferase/undecaprenyl-phosphate 4-deoxy-4-formamido-L-arabinose transferase
MKKDNAMPAFSIVIPVFNSTVSLEILVEKISAVMEGKLNSTYEILFIDDRSTNDLTWKIIQSLADKRSAVKGVRLRKNVGQHQATFCGFSLASGKTVITMDDDLQHDPGDIPYLLGFPEADAVIAKFRNKKQGVFRNLTSRIKDVFDTVILKKPSKLKLTSSFRVIRKEIVQEILKVQTSFPMVGSLIWSVTENIVNVPLDHHPRKGGKSGYTFFRRLALFSNLVFNHSSLILRFLSKLGILTAISGIIFGLVLVGRKVFLGNVAQGWTSIEVTILILGGLILLSLGVIGEYLYRILTAVEVRPRYVIDSTANLDRWHQSGELFADSTPVRTINMTDGGKGQG